MTDHVLPPKPSNEIKTLRKIGYSLETSIADILDNSITAKSKKIELEVIKELLNIQELASELCGLFRNKTKAVVNGMKKL